MTFYDLRIEEFEEVLFCCLEPLWEASRIYTVAFWPPTWQTLTNCQDVRLMTKQYYENHNQKPKEEAPRLTGESVSQLKYGVKWHERAASLRASAELLVGGLEHFLFFHSVGNVIIPTDELHHFSEGLVNHQPDIIWLSYGYCMVSMWLLYVIITIAIDIHWLSSLEKYPGISHSNWWIFETFPNFSSRTSKLSACPGQSVAVARLEGDNQPMPLSARQSLPVPPGSPRCNSPVSSCLIIRPYWCNVSLVN